MTEIEKIHDEVFEFLKEWSDNQHPKNLNRFFYLRTKNDERFKRGYWFPGDEKFVAVSFWTGGDSLNRTSNIYFSIDPTKGLYANLVARDSENKRVYFQILLNQLDGYKASKTKGIWRKYFGPCDKNYLRHLKEFILVDKQIIDRVLSATLENTGEADRNLLEDEFTSKFGFISEEQFYELRNRVDAKKITLKKDIELSKGLENAIQLPLALNSISIKNFQGIRHANVKNLPATAKWIFLTGENGFGKTSVLQAIALGITDLEDTRSRISNDSLIDVGFCQHGATYINSTKSLNTEGFKNLNNFFIAYGPSRLNTQASSSENQESRNSSNAYNLFNRDGLLKNVNYQLLTSSLQKNKTEFNNLRKVIKDITNGQVTDITIEEGGGVEYHEIAANGEILGKSTLETLSTGFQNLIQLATDIIIRFSKSQAQRDFKDFEGIVIIDELENHLHPRFQTKLPATLSKMFPNVQFIATTHSPLPLLQAPEGAVILNITRSSAKGIEINRLSKLEKEIHSLLPDTILTSSIFNFDYLEDLTQSRFSKKTLEDNYGDIEKMKKLSQSLKKIDKTIFPDNLFAED